MRKELSLTVNGQPYEVSINPNTLLVDVLRHHLGVDGDEDSLSEQLVRGLHRHSQWHGGEVVFDPRSPGGGSRDYDRGRSGPGREAASPAEGFPGLRGISVRFLHSGDARFGESLS